MEYDAAQPWFDADEVPTNRTNEMAFLEAREALSRQITPVILSLTAGPLRIESEYNYWTSFHE